MTQYNGQSAVSEKLDSTAGPKGNFVFIVSVVAILIFIVWAAIAPGSLGNIMGQTSSWFSRNLGWAYLLTTLGCVILMLYLGCSRFGAIRLGNDQDRPEFSTFSWIAMIMGAVMGIGLISFGAAEPLTHFLNPLQSSTEPKTTEAAVRGLQVSFFEWGPNAWALFGIFGLSIAYSTHRQKNSGLISPMLKPVLGRSMDGIAGDVIDIFTILATLFGTTTSLGLGASQVVEGVNHLVAIPTDTASEIGVIIAVTCMFTLSAFSGIGRGVKWISNITMLGAVILAAYILFTGPTSFITNLYFRSVGQFVGHYPETALYTPSTPDELEWMQSWTYFMLAWWLSWGAFVGIFLARISKGRTVREFVFTVLLVPTLAFSLWFTIMGGTAMNFEMFTNMGIGRATLENTNSTFFNLLSGLPLALVTTMGALAMIILFFVSSADSNTFVLSSLSQKGSFSPHRLVILMWGAFTGICAIVLLTVGGLEALQQAALLSAAPFTLIVALLGASLIRLLREESKGMRTIYSLTRVNESTPGYMIWPHESYYSRFKDSDRT